MHFRYFTFIAATILLAFARHSYGADPSGSIISYAANSDTELTADPASPLWRAASGVVADHDNMGLPLMKNKMEVRSRWTSRNLYLLFVCDFDSLNLKPQPNPREETNGLWNWDVAEAFIGDDFQNISRYKEFEVSPVGEWVDLDIDRSRQGEDSTAWRWNSGFKVKSRIDQAKKVWYAEMRIPFEAISRKPAEPGLKLRINLYRCAGKEPQRSLVTWRPTHAPSFHEPKSFGKLELAPAPSVPTR
jgi:hypothetical protein